MPDTIRTNAAILALFADNTSGAISEQDQRDAIVTMFSRDFAVSVTQHGAAGDNSTDDSSAVTAAVAAAGSGGAIFFPEGDYVLGSSVTISCVAILAPGAVIKPSTGNTVTYDKGVDAKASLHFGGAGSHNINREGINEAILPEWYGAVGDNATDDAAALQAALDEAARSGINRVLLGPKRYRTSVGLTTDDHDHVEIAGLGQQVTELKFRSNVTGNPSLLKTDEGGGQRAFRVYGILFEGQPNGGHLLEWANCKDGRAVDCQFSNGNASYDQIRIHTGTCAHFSILRCRFHNSSATHARHAMHFGGTASDTVSNIWIEECWSQGISAANAYVNDSFLHVNTAGNITLRNNKFNTLACPAYAFEFDGNGGGNTQGITIDNTGTEFTSGGTGIVDFRFKDCSNVTLLQVSAGNKVETGVVFQLVNVETLNWYGGQITGLSATADANCKNVNFYDLEINSAIVFSGAGMTNSEVYFNPGCRTINDAENITDTRRQGTATVAISGTTIVVAHGYFLEPHPSQIAITPDEDIPEGWHVTSVDNTNFTITLGSAAAAARDFSWRIT